MYLQLLIPTFNRATDLLKNLEILAILIEREGGSHQIEIVISDNCSSDETEQIVKSFKQSSPIEVLYHRHQSNIGLEPNMAHILGMAQADHVMFIGDDDFLVDEYLAFCLNELTKNPTLGAIIPGTQSLLANGNLVVGRKEQFDSKTLPAGFESALYASHLGHQLSGLVFKREGLLAHYLSFEEDRNPYPFIHFLTFALLSHGGVYAPKYKTIITTFNAKDWDYNKVGLLDEAFKSYYPFLNQLNEKQVADLILRFSILHSQRYSIKWNKPLRLLSQYKFLIEQFPKIKGIRRALANHLIKDYIKSYFY